jgi:hypothetical protein
LREEWSDWDVILEERDRRVRAHHTGDSATRKFAAPIEFGLVDEAPEFGEGEDAASASLSRIVTDAMARRIEEGGDLLGGGEVDEDV